MITVKFCGFCTSPGFFYSSCSHWTHANWLVFILKSRKQWMWEKGRGGMALLKTLFFNDSDIGPLLVEFSCGAHVGLSASVQTCSGCLEGGTLP
ncbi:hypothetical protein E2320_022242 [Naja naja]|nr:hypothetical protein E2320_022242 [Naja naja]